MFVVINHPGVDLAAIIYNLTAGAGAAYVEIFMRGSPCGLVYNLRYLPTEGGEGRMLAIRNVLLREFEYDRRGIHFVVVHYGVLFL